MRHLLAAFALILTSTSSHGALIGRAGGQAYYDDVIDVTWAADANLATTLGFATGPQTWAAAQAFIATLNSSQYLGATDWRLPVMIDTGAPGCDWFYSGTDCGQNPQTISGSTVYSELAYMYYVVLGNLNFFNTSGVGPQPGWGLVNKGPFRNLTSDLSYWFGTEYAPDSTNAWSFYNSFGSQTFQSKAGEEGFAWAVRSGDIAAVPVPTVGWLLAPAFLLAVRMGGRSRPRVI